MIVRLFIDLCMKKDWRIGTRVGLVMSQSKNFSKGDWIIGPSMSQSGLQGTLVSGPKLCPRAWRRTQRSTSIWNEPRPNLVGTFIITSLLYVRISWVMLGPHKMIQLLPQLSIWQVVSGRCVMISTFGDAFLLFKTCHVASCDKNCVILCVWDSHVGPLWENGLMISSHSCDYVKHTIDDPQTLASSACKTTIHSPHAPRT